MRYNPFNILRHKSWDRSPKDPMSIAVSLLGAASAGTFAAYALAFVIGMGISFVTSWALSALSGKPSGGLDNRGLLTNIKNPAAPRDYVYGETRKGGIVTYLESTGENNKFLHIIVSMAAHEVESITDFYINDEKLVADPITATVYNITLVGSRQVGGSEGEVEVYNSVYSFAVPVALDFPVGTITYEQYRQIFDQSYSKTLISGQEFSGTTFTSITITDKGTDTGYVADDKWKGKVRIEAFTGNQTAAPSTLLAESTLLTGVEGAKFIGYGIAYMYIRLEYDVDVFPNGIPVFTAMVKGKKVYDPRTGLTGYSANSALCIRDYIVSEYGLDDAGFVDDTIFAAAANVCDESVTLAAGGTQPRYEINGVVSSAANPGDILQAMTTSCAGTLFWGQGKWQLKPGYYTVPTKTLTLDDLRGPITLSTRNSRRDNFNVVRGTFNNSEARYVQEDYPEIKSAAFIAEDNGYENALDLALPLTTNSFMAQRLAKLTLFRGREQMTLSADFGMNAFDVQVGDIISFTNERYGWTEKEFEVLAWNFHPSGEGGDLVVSLILQETSSAAFDWNAEESAIIGNNTTLPIEGAGLTINSLIAYASGRVQSDGTIINAAVVSWAKPSSSFVDSFEIEWKVTTDEVYASTTTRTLSIELSPIIDSIEYTFRVRAVSVSGIRGEWASVTLTHTGDLIAPNAPTILSAVGYFQSSVVAWLPPTTNTDGSPLTDLAKYNIYRSLSNTFGTAALVGSSQSPSFKDVGLADNTTYYYWVTAVDYSGNESAQSLSANGTTNFISAAQMVSDIRDEIGAARIDVVSSLPSGTGYSIGDFVFLTSDKKLYEWTGSTWVATVGEVPTGSITSTKIANDAITTPKLATNSVTTDALAANSVTSDQLTTNSVIAGKISAGAVSADKIAVTNLAAINANLGVVTAGSITTLSGGVGLQVNVAGKANAIYVNQNSSGVYGLFADNVATGGGTTQFKSNGGFTSQVINNINGSGAFGPYTAIDAQSVTGGKARIAVATVGGGYGVDVYAGGYYDSSGVGYGPFTGRHDGMIAKGTPLSFGDIVVDVRTIAITLSDCFTEVGVSSTPTQKGAVGVITGVSPNWSLPASFIDQEATAISLASHVPTPSDPAGVVVTTHNISDYELDYDLVTINALGEGAINVCGEGGNISKGDLIVTSSIAGKGMKQADDIMRGYTVAKSREDVTFSDPTEVKMVACIYLCG